MQLSTRVEGMDIADRQLAGTGAILGTGQALLEAMTTGRATARILGPGRNECPIPAAHADVPVADIGSVEDRHDQIKVLGVKGLGELPATEPARAPAGTTASIQSSRRAT